MQYRPEPQLGGLNAHAHENLREIEANELSSGHRLLLPDGQTTAQVLEVDAVLDDFGRRALYFVALDNSINLRVAHGTKVTIAVPKPSRPADLLFAGPTTSTPAPLEPVGPTPIDATSPSRHEAHGDEQTRADLETSWTELTPDIDFADETYADETYADSAYADATSPDNAASPNNAAHPGAAEPKSSAHKISVPGADELNANEPSADYAHFEQLAHVPKVAERKPTMITLDTGDVVVVPGKARTDASGPSESLLRLIPKLDGNPEDLIRHIDAVHPGRNVVHQLSERLAKGINPKSGACLQDLRDLAYELFVGQNDAENALKVADLLAVIPFDGNPGRWSSVESGLALAAHLARERGEDDRVAAYSELLRAPETAEADHFRAQMAARVRQRTLNEPNLYDKEVTRAAEAGDEAEERNWRVLRLASLLHLRAHGGSEVFDDAELDRRIRIELDAVAR